MNKLKEAGHLLATALETIRAETVRVGDITKAAESLSNEDLKVIVLPNPYGGRLVGVYALKLLLYPREGLPVVSATIEIDTTTIPKLGDPT